METKQPDTAKELAKKLVDATVGKDDSIEIFLETNGRLRGNTVLHIIKESHNLEDFKHLVGGHVLMSERAVWVLARVSQTKLGVNRMIKSDWIVPSLFKTATFNGMCVSTLSIRTIGNITDICCCSARMLKKLKSRHPRFVLDTFDTLFECHEQSYEQGNGQDFDVNNLSMLLSILEHVFMEKCNAFSETFRELTKQDVCKLVNMMPQQPSPETAYFVRGLLIVFCFLCHTVGYTFDDESWGAELVSKCRNWSRNPPDEETRSTVDNIILLITENKKFALSEDLDTYQHRRVKSMRRCSGNGCSNRGSKTCTGCYGVHYCSETCQRRNWKFHRKICKETKKSSKASR